MQLLVVRHAPAESREEFAKSGRPDFERPLSEDGRSRMRIAALGLRTLVPELDVIGTSPYARALETAQIIAQAYQATEPVVVDALQPGRIPDVLSAWLQSQPRDASVAICGHEPCLSELVTWLLSGSSTPVLQMKKGAAILLECTGGIGPRGFDLIWAVPPKVLRALS